MVLQNIALRFQKWSISKYGLIELRAHEPQVDQVTIPGVVQIAVTPRIAVDLSSYLSRAEFSGKTDAIVCHYENKNARWVAGNLGRWNHKKNHENKNVGQYWR